MGEKLIYVHLCGNNWDGEGNTYQLLFAKQNKIDTFDDEDSWGVFPALGRPIVPPKDVISKVFTFETSITLILAQDSKINSMYDSMDGIIPLAYEDINGYEIYPEHRLVLHYGLGIDEVEEILSLSDITPEIEEYE